MKLKVFLSEAMGTQQPVQICDGTTLRGKEMVTGPAINLLVCLNEGILNREVLGATAKENVVYVCIDMEEKDDD